MLQVNPLQEHDMSPTSSRVSCPALAAFLTVLCVPAWAGDAIHKCRGADGHSHYQSTACSASQRTEWVRDYPVQAPSPVLSVPSAPAPRALEGDRRKRQPARTSTRRRQGSAQAAVISMHRDATACERAKKARDQAYARLDLKRDFATSRKLDDRVNEACR